MNVGLITYQVAHRRTFELSTKLRINGHRVTLFAFPFVKRHPRPSVGFQERPPQIEDWNVEDFCNCNGLGFVKVESWDPKHADMISGPDVWITCIAKIIPQEWIRQRVILNCHPGLLPINRGVDAWRRAIVQGLPIGVTLHQIDSEIDAGIILTRVRVPILKTDTLIDVAVRSYSLELDLMSNFDRHLFRSSFKWAGNDISFGLGTGLCHSSIQEGHAIKLSSMFELKKEELIKLSQDSNDRFYHPADLVPSHSSLWWKNLY